MIDSNEEVRLIAVTDLLLFDVPTIDSVGLLRKAIGDTSSRVRGIAFDAMAAMGGRLSSSEVDILEKEVTRDCGNLAVRGLLISYYSSKMFTRETGETNRQGHVLWLIENTPECELLSKPEACLEPDSDNDNYMIARRLWLEQIEKYSTDVRVIGNAAEFWGIHDERISEGLLHKAQCLDRDDYRWPRKLAQLYKRRLTKPGSEPRAALISKWLGHLKVALGLCREEYETLLLLSEVAKATLEAEELEEAEALTQSLLRRLEDYRESSIGQTALHQADLLLGRLALRKGLIDEAVSCLLKAGQRRQPHGPNTMLAKELLDRGLRTPVVQFLHLCASSIQFPNPDLEHWLAIVEHTTGYPDFSASLLA